MAVTRIPASDTYYHPSYDDALKAAQQAVDDAYDGWTVYVSLHHESSGRVTMSIDYAPPTEH